MNIEFIVVCHNFVKRFCWFLSSLVQQVPHPFGIIVNVATMGNLDTIKDLYFSKGIMVRPLKYDDKEKFAYRGLVYNDQVAVSTGEYLFFTGADHILHPHTIRRVFENVRAIDGFTSSPNKWDTRAAETDSVVGPVYVHNAWERASLLPILSKGDRRIGGWGIVKRNQISDGLYVDPRKCRDGHLFNDGQKTRSERAFRRRLGTTIIELPPYIHLNHARDKEVGHHIELKR